MNSDETLNAGSGEELPAEEVVGMDESASQETTDESGNEDQPKGKEKALRDTEAALKARQAEFHKLSQQMAEMRGQLTTLMTLKQQQEHKEEIKDWVDSLDGDKVIEDPLAAMKMMVSNLRKEFASVLTDRDTYLMSKVGGQSVDPEIKSIVDELKNDPSFSDLPDEKLVAVAKKMHTPKKAVMQPRGNIAGSSRASSSGSKAKDGKFTPEQIAWLRASGAMKTNQRDDTLE